MPLDPSIILGAKPPDVMGPGDIVNLRNALYRQKASELDLQEAQKSVQAKNALRGVYADSSNFDKSGNPTPNALNRVGAIDPDAAVSMRNNALLAQERQSGIERNVAMARKANEEAMQKERTRQTDILAPVAIAAVRQYDDAVARGVPLKEASQQSQKFMSDEFDRIEKEGSIPKDLLNIARQQQFNPYVIRAKLGDYMSKGGKEPPKTRNRISGGTSIQEEYDPISQRWREIGRGPRFSKQVDGESGSGEGLPKGVQEYVDPESGKNFARGHGLAYELVDGKWTKTTADKLPGGLVKAGSPGAGQGAREAVFTGRMLIGATEAGRDLANVSKLPVTSSSGMLGNYQPGSGLLGATSGVLARTVTGQDAQLYNVMATGFQRSLAQIESAGLAPSGSLTHQMDSVMIKEGDTVLTKLSKMAQTRQIVEAGMQPLIDNPRIPKKQKDGIKTVLDDIETAVPFTQEDIIDLAYGKANKGKTLGQVAEDRMKKSGKSKGKEEKGGKQDFSHLWGGAKKKAEGKSAPAPAGAATSAQGEDADEDSDGDAE